MSVNLVEKAKEIPTPLATYFRDINLDEDPDIKLAKILTVFSPTATLIDQNGKVYHGHDGIRSFYLSASSPVLNPGFSATPLLESMCTNGEGFVAIEICLSSYLYKVRIGDWFEIKNDLIQNMHVYTAKPIVE